LCASRTALVAQLITIYLADVVLCVSLAFM